MGIFLEEAWSSLHCLRTSASETIDFFFFSVRLERVCLYMSVLVRPVFVCVSVWEDGGLLQTINKEMNARGNETCSKQRRNQEVCREGGV